LPATTTTSINMKK